MESEPAKTDPSRPRRRFQFRLRTLLIAVTLLAVPLGYVGWQAKIVRARRSILELVVSRGGDYFSGDSAHFPAALLQDGRPRVPKQDTYTVLSSRDPKQAPSTIRRWLGDDTVYIIWLPESVPAVDADQIAGVFPEASVYQDRHQRE